MTIQPCRVSRPVVLEALHFTIFHQASLINDHSCRYETVEWVESALYPQHRADSSSVTFSVTKHFS
jgi:hypothetical protein